MSDRGEFRSIRTVIVDGPDFKPLHPNTKLVWFYIKLQLGPLGIGVFNAAKHVLSEQTGLTPRQVENGLKELDAAPQFFRREAGVFWIVGGLSNDPHMRSTNPNHRKSVQEIVNTLPRLSIVEAFKKANAGFFDAPIGEDASDDTTTIGMPDASPNGIDNGIPNDIGIKRERERGRDGGTEGRSTERGSEGGADDDAYAEPFVEQLLGRLPSDDARKAWRAEINASLGGMPGHFPATKAQIEIAARDMIANGKTAQPSLRQFRRYIQGASESKPHTRASPHDRSIANTRAAFGGKPS